MVESLLSILTAVMPNLMATKEMVLPFQWSMTLRLTSSIRFDTISNIMQVRIKVIFPIGSHNAKGFEDSAIHQLCDIRLLAGEAEVMMRFHQDEWYILFLLIISGMRLMVENLSTSPFQEKT
jgi:hypothetical protein